MGSMTMPSFLKRKPTQEKSARTKPQSSPYLDARKGVSDVALHQRSIMRLVGAVALFCLLVALVAVAGNIKLGMQSKFIPIAIEVDEFGNHGSVYVANQATPVAPNEIAAVASNFIFNARLVTPDVALQKKAVFDVYDHISKSDPAAQKMNEWLNGTPESSPFKRASEVSVYPEINSVVQASPSTWQVDWTEIVRGRDGVVIKKTELRALITTYISEPKKGDKLEDILKNPRGIFIKDFNWSDRT